MTSRGPHARHLLARRRAGAVAALAGALAAALVLGPAVASTSSRAADLGTPIPVKATPAPVNETAPAADGDWFLWARGHANLGPDDLYLAQRGDSPRIRISAPGTTVAGGGGISGRTVVYAQVSEDPHRAGLYRFDLRTRHRVRLPAIVNSRYREYSPSVSGRFLVFQRNKRSGDTHVSRVVLYDLVTHRLRSLATVRWSEQDTVMKQIDIGQINGEHVVWERQRIARVGDLSGTLLGSSVWHYDIGAGTRDKVARPDGFEDGDPAVSADGTVYVTRYTHAEEDRVVQVVRLPAGGTPEVVLQPEFSHSASDLFVDDRVGHRHHLYYVHAEYFPEDTSEYDVYKLVLPAPTP